MSTQLIAGYLGKMYGSIDAGANYREYGELRNYTLRRHTDMINGDSHASGAHDASPGLRSWDADAECLYISSDAAQDEVDTAQAAGTRVLFRFDPEGTGTPKERWSGAGYFEDIEMQSPTSDAALRSFKVHGVGELTKSTQ